MLSKPKVAIAINNHLCFSLQKQKLEEWRCHEEEVAAKKSQLEKTAQEHIWQQQDYHRKLLQFQKKQQLEEQGEADGLWKD